MKKILILIFIPIVLYSQPEKDFVGSWQSSPVLASGWEDTYLFFEDGNFKFFFNQMDCAKREVSYSGKWSLKAGDLELTVTVRIILEGGKMVLSTGSCGSDFTLIDAVEIQVKTDPPETIVVKDSKMRMISIDGFERKTLMLDGTRFWYYGDPKEMLKQFEN